MPKVPQKLYVCDRCERPFAHGEQVLVGHLVLWRVEDDPRKPLPKPSVADLLRGVAEELPPPLDMDAANPRFPFPKRRHTVDLLLHASCGAALTKLAEDEIARGYAETG